MEMVDSDKINAGLAAFRKVSRAKLGGKVYTRQNYLCCGGCASSALYEECRAAEAKRPNSVVGSVFYHKQDAYRMRNGGALYFNYGGFDEASHERQQALTQEIGKILVQCLREAGCTVEWSGDITARIKVEPEARVVYR
jgi:hypothetical protein